MGEKRKIGIMGGTFDPIHIGHLILAENAYQQYGLDEVWFMPSGNPPYKQHREGRASNEQRTDMVSAAIAPNAHFSLSLVEMHDAGYTYTSHTLRRLNEQMPDTDFYFIMGADSLLAFDSWRQPEEICRRCILVVAVRDHLPQDKLDEEISRLSGKYRADIRKLSTLNIDVSSHMLREWIAMGRSCRYYTPDSVIDYIERNGIYRVQTTDLSYPEDPEKAAQGAG